MNISETTAIPKTGSSLKMLYAMVGIGVLCALLIVLTYEGTLPRIEQLRSEALEKAIFKVIPGTVKTQSFQLNENQTFSIAKDETLNKQIVYAGYDQNDRLIGIAIEASGQGYADYIHILYGYDPDDQKIIGFHVLGTKETPGLGDKIEKDPDFLANFKALDVSLSTDGQLANALITVKNGTKRNKWEIDGITGATISSRAIGNMLNISAQRWVPLIEQNKVTFTLQ